MGSAKEGEGTVGRSAAQTAIKETLALIRSQFIILYRVTATSFLMLFVRYADTTGSCEPRPGNRAIFVK